MGSESKLKEIQKIIDAFLKDKQKPLIDWMVKDCTDMIRPIRADVDINWCDPPKPLLTKYQGYVMGKLQGIQALSEKYLQKLYILKIDDERGITEEVRKFIEEHDVKQKYSLDE